MRTGPTATSAIILVCSISTNHIRAGADNPRHFLIMKNISIKLSEETRRQIAQLAAWWGESPVRHNTPVISRCVDRVFGAESAARESAGDDTEIMITSRKIAERRVNPERITRDGKTYVALGSGVLGQAAAAAIDAGIIGGEYIYIVDELYYYNSEIAPSYDDLRVIVMLQVVIQE